jgi:hypothetical protein
MPEPLSDVTETLLIMISDRLMHQEDLSLFYAAAIMSMTPPDWAKINKAIMDRWSVTGLNHIKKLAWNRLGYKA